MSVYAEGYHVRDKEKSKKGRKRKDGTVYKSTNRLSLPKIFNSNSSDGSRRWLGFDEEDSREDRKTAR